MRYAMRYACAQPRSVDTGALFYVACMAGETGGDREGPSPPGPIIFLSWVGPGGTYIYLTKMGPFDAIARVLRRATKLVGSLRNLKYEDRLQILKIPSKYYSIEDYGAT